MGDGTGNMVGLRLSDDELVELDKHISEHLAWAEPGQLCQSDFTHMSSLEVTIQRQPFENMVYHIHIL